MAKRTTKTQSGKRTSTKKYGTQKKAVVSRPKKSVGDTQAMTPAMTDEMRDYRLYKLEVETPVKTRSDFQSDEEYRTYLLDTYVSLRQTEYEYTVRNETMKVYNLAADAQKNTRIPGSTHYDNQLVWDGYKKYIAFARTPEERARREQQVADCAVGRAPEIGGVCIGGKIGAVTPAEKLHCCAVTASCVVAQISGKMGYDGDDNLIVPKHRSVKGKIGRRNNIVAASNINQADSVQQRILVNPDIGYQPPKDNAPTLREAIKNGDLNIGDSFALGPKNPNAETTGHAMVVADIIRDKDGNITAYTIQGNNPHQLMTLGIDDKTGRGGSTVIAGVGTNAFMKGNFATERRDLSHLSIEELEARVVTQRSNTEQVITNLAETERFFADNKLYNDNAKGFVNNYVKQYDVAKNDTSYREMNAVKDDVVAARVDLEPIEEVTLAEPLVAQTDVAEPMERPAKVVADVVAKSAAINLFTILDETKWQQLVAAYLTGINKDMSVADVMHGDAVLTKTALADGKEKSLVGDLAVVTQPKLIADGNVLTAAVDGKEAATDEDVVTDDRRKFLADDMIGDKTKADGLFGSLLEALTTHDDKDLNDSMKFALNLLTSFFGADKTTSDDVPSLCDFMSYLVKDNDIMLAQTLENETKAKVKFPVSDVLRKTTVRDDRC